jgi:hypothetical protein
LPCFFFFGDFCCGFLAVDLRDPLDFAFDFGGAQSGVLPPCSRRMTLRQVYLVYMDLGMRKTCEGFLGL